MKYTRIFADSSGETHFEDVEDQYVEVELAPTAVMGVTGKRPARNVRLGSLPPGYSDDFHPAPVPYLVAYLGGEVDITTSDGETRSFKPGDVSVQADVKGRGHKNRVVGKSPCEFLLVELDEEQ